MLRKILLASAVVLCAPSLALAQIVELEGRYWFTNIEGKVKITSGSVEGTNVDLEDDLDIEAENAPGVRLTFGLPFNNKIRLAYTYLSMEGDATLQRTIAFNGSTFNANTQVHSTLDVHYGRVAWIWQPIAIPGLLKLGPMLELKGVQLDGTVETRDASPAIREDKDLGLLLPTIGAALDFTPHRMIHVFAEASGLPAGSLGYVVDAEAGIRIVPFPLFSIAAGYRYFGVKVEEDDDSGRIKLHGPFIGVSVRF